MTKWRPILRGERREAALGAARDISKALRAHRRAGATEPGLAGGAAGGALFQAYFAQATDSSRAAAEAGKYLVAAAMAELPAPWFAGFFAGMPGIAFVAQHVMEDGLVDEFLGQVDATMMAAVAGSSLRDYDLVSGLVGVGTYALERGTRGDGRALLEAVLRRLEETAVKRTPGLAWKTLADQLPPGQRAGAPAGYYNLGVAHGVPGVVGLAADALLAGSKSKVARRLIDPATEWMLACARPGGDAWFPCWILEDGTASSSRTAWCYGDLGVAAVLWSAARARRRRDWAGTALELAHAVASRSAKVCGVTDASLCHGAAGLGHVLNRLYQATGEEQLRDAAVEWFDRTLAMRGSDGCAGFTAFEGPKRDPGSDPCFLTGAAGIGLALLAAATNVEPSWDRALLCRLSLAKVARPRRASARSRAGGGRPKKRGRTSR